MHMLVYYDTCMVYIYVCMCKCMYVCTCIHTNTCAWICIYVQLFLLYLTQYTAILSWISLLLTLMNANCPY